MMIDGKSGIGDQAFLSAHPEELELIIDKSPVILFLWRAEEGWPVEFVSDNISQLGYKPEDFYSGRLSYASIIHPDDLQKVADEVRSYSSDPTINEFCQEYRILNSDNQIRWIDDRTYIRRDYNGKITHYQGIILDITERKQAENKFRDALALIDSIIDNIPNPIFYKDKNCVYQGCNKAFAEQILGMPKEEIIGKTVFDLKSAIPQENAKIYHERDLELIRNPGNQTYEAKVKCTDGKLHDFYFSKATYKTNSGDTAGIVGVMLDITERKKTEERLGKLNKCLLGFEPDPDKNLNALVKTCGELLGGACAVYNRLEDGMLKAVARWNTPPDFQQIDKPDGHICYDVIKQGKNNPVVINNLPETPYFNSDCNVKKYGLKTYIGQALKLGETYAGSLCVAFTEKYDLSKEDIELFSFIASAVCNEEERRKLLYESEKVRFQQKAILDNIPDIVWLKDDKERYIAANESFLKACDKNIESIINNTDFDIWPPELAAKYQKDDLDVMKTGKRCAFEEPIVYSNGLKTWVETIKTPIFDLKGNIIGTAGIARDITQRKKTEEELKNHTMEIQQAKEIAEKSAVELAKTVRELTIAKQDLQRFNSAAVGREMRIIEMKKEVNALLEELGREPKYKMAL